MGNIINQPLYKIANNFKEVERMVEDGEIELSDITDQLEAFKGEFKEKAIQICMIIKNINPTIDNIDLEIKRLQARKKTVVNRKEHMSNYLRDNMEKMKEKKVSNDLFGITLCNGKEVVIIDNEDDISDEYIDIDTVISINKKLLLQRLKDERDGMEQSDDYDANNEMITGAHIERSKKYIMIK